MSDFKKMAVIVGMVAAMGSFAAPVQAKNFIEEWFPFLFEEEKTDSIPAQDGKMAPFQGAAPVLGYPADHGTEYKPQDAAEGTAPQAGVDYKPYNALESGVALNQPHRQPAQLTVWASKAVSDALDFDPLQYETHISGTTNEPGINQYMTPVALESFKALMAKDNLLEALKTNNLVMRAFVIEPSRLLNQGAVQDRYRWLMETPVTISFMPRGVTDYAGIQPKSQKINVRTQVGRVAEGGDDGVMIETMEFLPVAAK